MSDRYENGASEGVRRIEVALGFVPKSYGSFHEAVSGDFGHSKAEALGKRVLEGYTFSGEELSLQLSGELFLFIWCSDQGMKWSIEDVCPDVEPRNKEPVVFVLPKGSTAEWVVESTLDGLIGSSVRLAPSEQFLFLQTREDEYTISFFRDRATGSKKYLTPR